LRNSPKDISSRIRISSEISALQQSMEWVLFEQKNRIYNISMLPFSQSSSSQILTGFSKRGSLLYSSNEGSKDKVKDKWTGQYVYSLYEFDSLQNIIPFASFANNNFHTALLSFNSNEDELIFTSCDVFEEGNYYCKIFYSRKLGEGWTEPIVLNFSEPKVNYMQGVFHPSNDYIVFSSNLNSEVGEYNLYYANKNGPIWSEPQKFGLNINSMYDEVFPTFKGDTLFFSSNKPSGMGGLDIYYVFPMGQNQMSSAVNVKYPINSPADDFGLYLLEGNDSINWKGYFTSNRNGYDNIYSFERNIQRENKIVQELARASMEYYAELSINTFEKEFNIPDDPLSGTKIKKPLANVDIQMFEEPTLIKQYATNRRGVFIYSPDFSKEYKFIFSKEGYLTNSISFTCPVTAIDSTVEKQSFVIQVLMEKILLDKEIVLESIFYDFDKWDIRDDARPSLDTLYSMMIQNPKVKIELSSHTDCRGDADYNLKLSQKRADSAVLYLIEKGIPEERMTSKGYGKKIPAIDCKCEDCTEEEHQRNRRTSFKIIDL
jgi:outer membrane protein OmpA-like peptidoglycan-associated protein